MDLVCGLVYDPERDEVVLCEGGHEYSHVLWFNPNSKVRDKEKCKLLSKDGQPVWAMNLERKEWKMLSARLPTEPDGESFQPAVYDPERKKVVALCTWGVRELGGERDRLDRLGKGTFGLAHQAIAYDVNNKAILVYGRYRGSDDVLAYYTSSGKGSPKYMPTSGQRPPKAPRGSAMTYDPGSGKIVAVIPDVPQDPKAPTAGTWIYDLGADAWKRLPDGDLKAAGGAMVYDPNHNVCLFVVRNPAPTAVWAIKLDAGKLPQATKQSP
jgi:hypothetical protein